MAKKWTSNEIFRHTRQAVRNGCPNVDAGPFVQAQDYDALAFEFEYFKKSAEILRDQHIKRISELEACRG